MAVTENSDATVKIEGNKNLDGNYNTIKVIATAKDLKTTKTYVINVVKEGSGKTSEEGYYEDVVNSENINQNIVNETEEKETKSKWILITAVSVVMVLLVVIFIMKGSKKGNV